MAPLCVESGRFGRARNEQTAAFQSLTTIILSCQCKRVLTCKLSYETFLSLAMYTRSLLQLRFLFDDPCCLPFERVALPLLPGGVLRVNASLALTRLNLFRSLLRRA
jgi:hypothetical protein